MNKVESGGYLHNSQMELKSEKKIAFGTSLSLRNFKARILVPREDLFPRGRCFNEGEENSYVIVENFA